jgi:hypothetical protein
MSIHFLVATKERKQILPLGAFFNRHFRVGCFFWSTVLFVWWGLVRLVTGTTVRVWQLRFNYPYFHELLARCPRQTIAIQCDNKVKTSLLGNGCESEKKRNCLHFLLQMISLTTFWSLALGLSITLYICNNWYIKTNRWYRITVYALFVLYTPN